MEHPSIEDYELSSARQSDDFYEKERELKEITEMRIKTLERIIKEKVQVIAN